MLDYILNRDLLGNILYELEKLNDNIIKLRVECERRNNYEADSVSERVFDAMDSKGEPATIGHLCDATDLNDAQVYGALGSLIRDKKVERLYNGHYAVKQHD